MKEPGHTAANRSSLEIRIFNPHRLADEDLERTFIARRSTYEAILGDIASEPAASRPQHHLVVGQRGMGKTTLLLRLALELRREPRRSRFIPLRFPEDLHVEIDRLSKFWLACLDALADALEAGGDTRRGAAIDERVAAIVRHRADEALVAEEARRSFSTASEETGLRPVLFVDNFNLLLNRLKSHDYALRGYFMAPGAPILVGSCTDISQRLQDYGAAFYEGFKHHWLRPLSLDEMREMLFRLAQASGRSDVTLQVDTKLPQIAALRDLSGGNPRTTVFLFDLMARGASGDLQADLDSLLDLVTPLYQSRLEQLADQAQVVVGAMARHWHPLALSELCAATGLAGSSVSPQLARLKELGLVEEASLFPTSRSGYQIAERFFNIWYLMRFASRRQRSELAWLAWFLQTFHTPKRLVRTARHLRDRRSLDPGQIPLALALAESIPFEPGLASQLSRRAHLELVQRMNGVRDRIAKILDPEAIDRRVYAFAELSDRLHQAVPRGARVAPANFAGLVLGSPALLAGPGRGRDDRIAIAGSELTAARVSEIASQLRQEARELERRYGRKHAAWLRERLRKGEVTSWKDPHELASTLLVAKDAATIRMVLDFADPGAAREVPEDAFGHVRRHLEPGGDAKAQDWFAWAVLLNGRLRRYPEAEEAFRKAISLDPTNARPVLGRAFVLHLSLGRYAEAEETYRKAIVLDPEYSPSFRYLGILLQYDLGRYTEAEEVYRKAIALDRDDPKPGPWVLLGHLLAGEMGRHAEAEEAYRRAIALDPGDLGAWNGLGCVLLDTSEHIEEARRSFERAIKLDAADSTARHNLAFVLRDYLGDPSSAREVLAGIGDPEPHPDTRALHEALFAAYDDNWGLAGKALSAAMTACGFVLSPLTRDDWFRTSAVLLNLGFGEKLVELLETQGAGIKMLPWFAAVRAHARGDRRYLLNMAPEVRTPAERIFDAIEGIRGRLPRAGPEPATGARRSRSAREGAPAVRSRSQWRQPRTFDPRG